MSLPRRFGKFLKFFPLPGRAGRDSGIILLTVLWALVILTILAVGLGRNTDMDLLLTKHAIAKIKAKYLARAGLVYAVEKIREDTEDPVSRGRDTLYHCGVPEDEEHPPRAIFQKEIGGEGSFDIYYRQKDFDGGGPRVYPGMQDEERKVNINALRAGDVDIFVSLMDLLGFDEPTAKTVAFSILDWKDEDDELSDPSYGAEEEYYGALERPYRCKNRPFDSQSELRLVRGVTPEIFQALSGYITVFPREGRPRLNFDTAPEPVLKSFVRALSGAGTNTDESDADALSEKILNYRRGEDGEEFTEDDRVVDSAKMDLNAKEKALFLSMGRFRAMTSDYLRVRVRGVEQSRRAESGIEAVIRRDDLSVVYWHRD